MTEETETAETSGTDEAPGRAWRPSGRPEHRIDDRPTRPSARIIERTPSRGWLRGLTNLLKSTTVRIAIGVGLFVLAAIVFDATINGGSWTERPPKSKQMTPR